MNSFVIAIERSTNIQDRSEGLQSTLAQHSARRNRTMRSVASYAHATYRSFALWLSMLEKVGSLPMHCAHTAAVQSLTSSQQQAFARSCVLSSTAMAKARTALPVLKSPLRASGDLTRWPNERLQILSPHRSRRPRRRARAPRQPC